MGQAFALFHELSVHWLIKSCFKEEDQYYMVMATCLSRARLSQGGGNLPSLDQPGYSRCQVPQYRHLRHHVWKDFGDISESITPIHTASCHIWTHLLHDLL